MNCLDGLKELTDESVDCCVTSPPYYGLRDYGHADQIGMEETPEKFVQNLVEVFREVKRVLKDDGTLWLNLGDSYWGGKGQSGTQSPEAAKERNKQGLAITNEHQQLGGKGYTRPTDKKHDYIKPKDLIGIPWMVAFALRADGWYLRQDIIWAKKNCMPESVTDRCTKSHEYIFMLSKSSKYYYDQKAIMEPAIYDVDGTGTASRKARANGNKLQPTETVNGIRAGLKDARLMEGKNQDKQRGHSRRHDGFNDRWDKMTKEEKCTGLRNKRDVWTISPAQYPEAHFATFPEEIPAICIKAGCPINGLVLDPFSGAGTTALVARKLGRNFIGFELNPKYVALSEKRIKHELGLFP